MKLQFHRNRFVALALLGSAATPFLSLSQNAVAAPYGKPSKEKRKAQKRADRLNRGNRNITVLGTVVRDTAGNDRFVVRLDNGRTVEVISRDREPRRISRGDRVELRGDFENNLFIADRVQILHNVGNGGSNSGQQTTLRGRVVRDFYGRDFEIVTDNGATVRVRSLRPEPIRLTNGDRVTVQGRQEGNVFVARDVNVTRNDDRQRVDFPGTVQRRESSGRLIVRGDNGRTYTVISNASLSRFDRNDRVRVVGFVNGGLVAAQSVILLQNR